MGQADVQVGGRRVVWGQGGVNFIGIAILTAGSNGHKQATILGGDVIVIGESNCRRGGRRYRGGRPRIVLVQPGIADSGVPGGIANLAGDKGISLICYHRHQLAVSREVWREGYGIDIIVAEAAVLPAEDKLFLVQGVNTAELRAIRISGADGDNVAVEVGNRNGGDFYIIAARPTQI